MTETRSTGASNVQGAVAKAVLSLTFAIAAGAASGSAYAMLIVFAMTLFAAQMGAVTIGAIAGTSWGEKPIILMIAIGRSVATAAFGVAAFGILLGGSVALNQIIADFGMRELDVWIGILPFAGIIAYCVITAPSSPGGRRSVVRILTRGVVAAALAAVVLYMIHATGHVVGML